MKPSGPAAAGGRAAGVCAGRTGSSSCCPAGGEEWPCLPAGSSVNEVLVTRSGGLVWCGSRGLGLVGVVLVTAGLVQTVCGSSGWVLSLKGTEDEETERLYLSLCPEGRREVEGGLQGDLRSTCFGGKFQSKPPHPTPQPRRGRERTEEAGEETLQMGILKRLSWALGQGRLPLQALFALWSRGQQGPSWVLVWMRGENCPQSHGS